MQDFKAKFKRSHYKSDSTYLDAVYRNNKQIIDAAYQDRGKPKVLFKQQAIEYMEQGKTMKEALKTISRKRDFTSEREQFVANFKTGFKGLKLDYKQFREATKVGGRYTKFDENKLTWSRKEGAYIYDASYDKVDKKTGKVTHIENKVMIKLQNSPKGLNILQRLGIDPEEDYDEEYEGY